MARRVIGWTAVAAVIVATFIWWGVRERETELPYPLPGETGATWTLEVLNGAGIDGLAAAVTRRLRRFGLDVVYYGTASVDTFSQTQILLRRSDTTVVPRIREALGVGVVREELDSLRLLDVSIVLGRDAGSFAGRP